MEQERFHPESESESESGLTDQEQREEDFSPDFDIIDGGYETDIEHLSFGEPLEDGSSVEQTTGERWDIYPVSSDDDEENTRRLFVTQRLYHYLDIPIPEIQFCKYRGKLALAIKVIETQPDASLSQISAQEETRNGFLIDALTNNNSGSRNIKLNSRGLAYRILFPADNFFRSDRNIQGRLVKFAENPIYEKVTRDDQAKMAERITRLLTDEVLIKLARSLYPDSSDEWERSAFIAGLLRDIEEIREHFSLSKKEKPIPDEEWEELCDLLLPEEQLEVQQKNPEKFRKRCEEMRENRFSHVLSRDEARSSLQDGYLTSARELVERKQPKPKLSLSRPSKVSPKAFVSFTINSAEMGYGQVEGEDFRPEETVAYLFNTEGLKNNILQIHPTTSLSRFKELRTHSPSEENLPKADINLGIFIAPRSQKETWIEFLLKPISEGGAGKDEDWISTHVYFYAEDTDLERVITYIERYPELREKLRALTPPKPGIMAHTKREPKSIRWTEEDPQWPKFEWKTLEN